MTSLETETRYQLTPIGRVENRIDTLTFSPHGKDDIQARRQQIEKHRRETREAISTLVISPEFEPLLDGIEDFSHVDVIFWPHRLTPEDRKLQKVHPMGRKDIPLKGIFATRSPARPNPLLVTTVKLLERQGRRLRVRGLDAVNQSPILDIKPMTHRKTNDEEAPVFPDWIHQINQEMKQDGQ